MDSNIHKDIARLLNNCMIERGMSRENMAAHFKCDRSLIDKILDASYDLNIYEIVSLFKILDYKVEICLKEI